MAELDTNINQGENIDTTEVETVETEAGADNTELTKLKAELAKQKAALDKATSEAASMKKQLRAKQSAEEIAAEEKRVAEEAMQNELNTLRKRFAVAEMSKKVMGFVGDEAAATSVAEYLYGAEDADAALAALQKAWTAKEKALRLEYGKIPSPGVGGADGPTLTKEQLDGLSYMERIEFANKHPDEYNKLMGRT